MTADQPFPLTHLEGALERLESGHRPSGGSTPESGEVPSLGGENIDISGRLNLELVKRVPESFFALMSTGHLQRGDVLINKDGAQTGKVAQYRGEFPRAAINEHVFLLRGKPDRLDQSFLFHHLMAARTQAAIRRYITGSAQPGLNRAFIQEVRIALPALCEQHRMAEIFDSVDEAIRSTKRVIAKLKQMEGGLLHDILTTGIDSSDALRGLDHDRGQFRETPLGLRPRPWSLARLGDLANTFAGGTPSRSLPGMYDGDVPWVKSGELNRPSVLYTDESITKHALAASSAKLVPAGVPIIAMYGATAGMVSWLEIEAATNQAVLAIVPRERTTSPRWLYWELTFATERLLTSIQGSGQPNLSKNILDDTLIAVPEPEEQARIAEVADGLMRRTHDEQTSLVKLLRIKQGITNDLLTGRVRVGAGTEGAA